MTKTESGTWRVDIRRRGHPRIIKNFRLKREGEAWARRTEDEMSRGVYLHRDSAEQTTIAGALERYLNEVSVKKAPGTHAREIKLARGLVQRLGNYTLATMTPNVLAKFRDERLKTVSSNTVRLDLALISHLFTIAIKEWQVGLPFNPVLNISKPAPARARERRLMGDEEERLLAACDAYSNPTVGWVVRIALATAMRKEEILKLRRSDVDLTHRIATVQIDKNQETRHVPLSADAVGVFERVFNRTVQPIDTDLLFYGDPGADGERDFYEINKAWRVILARAGIEALHFHDLRHEAISRMVEKGMPDQFVMAVSGHKTHAMLKRYTHLKPKDIVAKMDAIGFGKK
ncbi:MAG: site-specific integrase [Magnetococcales bacterium]|nr:site-specific integrase [Magnetococcales bacterium]